MSLVQVSGQPLSVEPRTGLVRLLCGVAGAGKTTYAQQLESRGFQRQSIDEEIWRWFGRYGVDYERAEYESHQEVAGNALRDDLVRLMRDRTPVVVDPPIWQGPVALLATAALTASAKVGGLLLPYLLAWAPD